MFATWEWRVSASTNRLPASSPPGRTKPRTLPAPWGRERSAVAWYGEGDGGAQGVPGHRAHAVIALVSGGDLAGVLQMMLHAQRQRLQTLPDQEGVERGDRGAQVAQQGGAGTHGEGSGKTSEDETVVGLVGLVE